MILDSYSAVTFGAVSDLELRCYYCFYIAFSSQSISAFVGFDLLMIAKDPRVIDDLEVVTDEHLGVDQKGLYFISSDEYILDEISLGMSSFRRAVPF